MAFQRLRGTHDIHGDEAALFAAAEGAARAVFPRFGFEEIRTPFIEEKRLFTHALGTETDVVQKEMYEFTDRSQTVVALRPEGTAGVVRAYIENNFQKTRGLAKFFYMGPMFRSERPQAGRLRQFNQIGTETLGTSSPYADAETVLALTAFLDAAGVTGYTVRLNNLGTFEERRHFKEALTAYFGPKSAHLCEDCRNRLARNVFRLLDCKVAACRQIVKGSPPITGYLSAESASHFDKALAAIEAGGVPCAIDPYMVRGLDYYTRTVFELSHPGLGAQDALAAGGRYDHLVESLGGALTGAVGFALGVERLLMCLGAPAAAPLAPKAPIFIVTLGEEAFKIGFRTLSALRREGVAAEMDLDGRSMKSQMRAADGRKSRWVVILGDNEIRSGEYMLKDMTTGQQKPGKLDSAPADLKELFKGNA